MAKRPKSAKRTTKTPKRTTRKKAAKPTRGGSGSSNAAPKPARPSAQRSPAPPAASPGPVPLYVLSDSTGNLARHMLTAFLTQFPADAFDLKPINFLANPDAVAKAVRRVEGPPAVVFHALVLPESKRIVAEHCATVKVPARDLTGGFVDFLAEASGVAPTPDPRRIHRTDAQYFSRIKALEFTLEHDDGLGLETIHEADVVLTGVSRTSKSPTSIYLAQLGYKVANVSLAKQVPPPQQLLALPLDKVIALIIDPATLTDIRTRRQKSWQMSDTSYNQREHVEEEILWSRRLFAKRGWRVLDVTNQAIEETAGRIIDIMRERGVRV